VPKAWQFKVSSRSFHNAHCTAQWLEYSVNMQHMQPAILAKASSQPTYRSPEKHTIPSTFAPADLAAGSSATSADWGCCAELLGGKGCLRGLPAFLFPFPASSAAKQRSCRPWVPPVGRDGCFRDRPAFFLTFSDPSFSPAKFSAPLMLASAAVPVQTDAHVCDLLPIFLSKIHCTDLKVRSPNVAIWFGLTCGAHQLSFPYLHHQAV
jgi:hypothetical protein